MATNVLVSKATTTTTPLTEYPIDIISSIATHLDLCTLWNLADTCRFYRYHLLAIRQVWRRIVIDLKYCNHTQLYAGLRRFRDSNGLRSLVQEVIMDGNDDANISFIIMFVKFPELRHLSARYRRFSTNVEADTKVLQELLKNGTLKPHSIPLERVNIYHYYFNTEPHLDAFQKTLNRISKFPVHLDIRRCYVPTTTTTTTTSSNGDGDARQQEQQRSLEEAMEGVSISEACYNIVSKEAQCWACLHSFERCWKCESICAACQRTRLPPLANDQKLQDFQRRRRGRRHTQREKNKSMVVSAGANDLAVTITPTTATTNSSVIDDPSLEDEFSVFE